MTIRATSALAVGFPHTSAAPDITLTFSAGASPVTASVATGTYRMCLAPSGSDFLRALQAAINAALATAVRAETCTVSLTSAGIVSITLAGSSELTTVTLASATWLRLGFASATPTVSVNFSVTGTRPVWYLALFASLTDYAPQPQQPGGVDVEDGGRVYSFGAPATSYLQTAAARFIPWDPTQKATQGCEGTAMYAALAYAGSLGSTAAAREWSLLDVFAVAGNAVCGLALGTWQTLLTSTTDYYWRGYVAPPTRLSPEVRRFDRRVTVWAEMTLAVSHPSSSPTGTRA